MSDRLVRVAPFVMLTAVTVWVAEHAWQPLHDPDTWWHLRLGEEFLRQGSLAAPSDWSSYATERWVPTEPLPEAMEALVYRLTGLPGVAWTYVVAVVSLVLTVFLVCRRYASPMPAAVATVLFVAAGQGSLTPRPQLISYFLVLVTIEAWRRTQEDLRPRWWLVPLTWLWSLCHGFWFIGVGYGALAVASLALGRRAGVSVICRSSTVVAAAFAVVLLNPNGPAVLEGPFQVSGSMNYVIEWSRPSITNGPALTATAMAVAVAAVWLSRREFNLFEAFVLLSAVFFDRYALRTIVIGALVAAPILAGTLQKLIRTIEVPSMPGGGRREILRIVVAGASLVGLAAAIVPRTATAPSRVPTALNAQLDALPHGTGVFNDYLLGGWISWRHPDLNQYIDGLITPYSTEHIEEFYRTQTLAAGWYSVVRQSRAPVALVDGHSALGVALENRGWTYVGSDSGYVLLRRPALGSCCSPSSTKGRLSCSPGSGSN